jgi:hypothetical protein
MAIYYKDINTPRSLIVRILFSFLPFTFYFNIVSCLRINDWLIEHAIMANNSSTVQSRFRSLKYNEFINVSNSKYTDYKSQVASGNKDLLADFSNAIIKIRRDLRPDIVLNFNDISSIKMMASVYGFNREITLNLKGLANGKRGNFPTYSWSGNWQKARPIVVELERVRDIHILTLANRNEEIHRIQETARIELAALEAARIKENCKIQKIID